MSNERDSQPIVVSVLAIAAILVLAGLGVWAYDRSVVTIGDGTADLDVEFSVVDSATQAPIGDAKIEIQRVHYGVNPPFNNLLIRTDPSGKSHYDCPSSASGNRESALGFTCTYTVLPPEIAMRVSADGYEPREWGSIGVDFGKGVRSIEIDGTNRFPVRIEMRKAKQ
jgi:hypothetical protein